MTDNLQLYHTYQMNASVPTGYITKSAGPEPIIQALRQRRDSDPILSRRKEVVKSTGDPGDAEATEALFPMIARLFISYSQMLNTMADVR